MQPYEARFASMFGGEYYAFAFWKARVALYAVLKALGLENDEVILPGYTCIVVPNAIRHAGGKPVYADIALGNYNLDPACVEERLTSRTRALIVQHSYGIPADLGSLRAIADRFGLYLIEDCAHVLLGASYEGKLLGTFGEAAFFSFQWSKPYTTGLGGMVLTQDEELAERLKRIKATFIEPPFFQRFQLQFQYSLYHHFFEPKLYWFSQKSLHVLSRLGVFVGSSTKADLTGAIPPDIRWTMSDFQQRLGLAEIEKLEENSTHRRLLTKYYSDSLRQHGWPTDDNLDSDDVTLLRFPLQLAGKARVLEESRRAQIEIGSWFESPLHPLPLSGHHLISYQLGCCPIAELTASRVINLPLHARITQAEAERIVHFILSHAKPV